MFTTRTISFADLGLDRRGDLELSGELPPAPRVAIIGSRAAQRRCLVEVPAIVDAAHDRDHGVVSGGALGIDSAAHRAALERGVRQLAILPASPDAPYPPGNRELFAAIARAPGSGVAFTLARGQRPFRALFASRNAHVVGLSRAVVVVQASTMSGSCASGRLALRQGRPVAAVIGTPGCAALIAAGATPLVIDGPRTIADQVRGWLDAQDGREAPAIACAWPSELAHLEAAFERAGPRGVTIDDLAGSTSGFLEICEAEARGLVFECEPGRYRRIDRPPA